MQNQLVYAIGAFFNSPEHFGEKAEKKEKSEDNCRLFFFKKLTSSCICLTCQKPLQTLCCREASHHCLICSDIWWPKLLKQLEKAHIFVIQLLRPLSGYTVTNKDESTLSWILKPRCIPMMCERIGGQQKQIYKDNNALFGIKVKSHFVYDSFHFFNLYFLIEG